MQVSVQGRQVDVGDAFREHIEAALTDILDKYFGDAIEATVTISREAHLFKAVISAHIGHGVDAIGSGEADQPYPAFDKAAEHLAKRLRRHKRRLRDHSRKMEQRESMIAQQYILAGESPEEEPESETGGEEMPLVVAEMTTEIPTLTVSQAVMRMDLSDVPALLFRNSGNGGINMVYRRSDENIGWIDPTGNSGAES